ncbi:DUF6895 family protein, partial [Streptococcus pyogenes]|uniref:DUF6895 family protein n=1 Tax=Streptococcus pyogenes TaxID=1314 RepID=UPI003DA10153
MKLSADLDKLLGWVLANIDEFKLRPTSDLDRMLGGLKPLGELVLCADLLRPTYPLESEAIVALAWKEVASGDLLLETLTARPDLVVLAALYSNFKAFGYGNARLDSLFQLLSGPVAISSLEFP